MVRIFVLSYCSFFLPMPVLRCITTWAVQGCNSSLSGPMDCHYRQVPPYPKHANIAVKRVFVMDTFLSGVQAQPVHPSAVIAHSHILSPQGPIPNEIRHLSLHPYQFPRVVYSYPQKPAKYRNSCTFRYMLHTCTAVGRLWNQTQLSAILLCCL